jgi:hypothetical protein
VGLVLLAVAAVAVLTPPLLKARRRAARRRRADPAERIAGAWAEAVDRLCELGASRPVHRTPAAVAAGSGPMVGAEAATALGRVAGAHTEAQFGAGPVTDADADAAWAGCDEFRRHLDGHLGWRDRLRVRFGPVGRGEEVGAGRSR